jgi:hypothetical protein
LVRRSVSTILLVVKQFFNIHVQALEYFRQGGGVGFGLATGFIPADAVAGAIRRDIHKRDHK